jgi:cell division protein FtsW (lipid II flippase)
MSVLQRIRWREVPWGWLGVTLLLTAIGIAFVISACFDPGARFGLGIEARKQLVWWGISLVACGAAAFVPLARWKAAATPLYVGGIALQCFMMLLAGTALVPRIKGQANWLVLGPFSLQPTELIKIITLLACARLLSSPEFDLRRPAHLAGAFLLAAFPAGLIAIGNDLGSALTFPAMIFGMLLVAGIRWRHLGLALLLLLACATASVLTLPKEGPKSYQHKRIEAWLHPDEYALTEGYQTIRSVRSIGSGQWLGKGYGAGDQNRLGWLPEKHTDLIFAVVGEEVGFVGSSLVVGLFLLFAWLGLQAAALCRDPCGRLVISGYVCLVLGQAAINLAVAMGLMPVTGVTLPFFSYGGSSLLACYLGLGLCIAATMASRRELE